MSRVWLAKRKATAVYSDVYRRVCIYYHGVYVHYRLVCVKNKEEKHAEIKNKTRTKRANVGTICEKPETSGGTFFSSVGPQRKLLAR